MSWESWFQDVAGSVINKAADAKYTQPYEIDKLRIQALGDLGYYTEGQAGATSAPTGVLGMSQGTLLLVGGVILAVLMLRD